MLCISVLPPLVAELERELRPADREGGTGREGGRREGGRDEGKEEKFQAT